MHKLLYVTLLMLIAVIGESLQVFNTITLKHFQSYNYSYYKLNKNNWQNYLSRDLLKNPNFNAERLFQNIEKYDTSLYDGLFLERNKIEILTSNFFNTINNITFLSLRKNRMQKIEEGAFHSLKKLILLLMEDNELQELSSSTFAHLESLLFLRIDRNNLKTLHADIFIRNVNLMLICLKGNPLRSIPEGLFKNNKKLIKVNLRNVTSLTNLPNGLFSNNSRLLYVYLNYCNLTILPENLFQDSVNLLHIYLDHNALHTLPSKLFQGLTDLQILKLNDNKLHTFSPSLFNSCSNVKELYLNGNDIETIMWSMFTELYSLHNLYLNHNKITNFDVDLHIPSAFVRYINLSHNNISDLNPNFTAFFESLAYKYSHLEILDLSHNKFHLKSKEWIKKLPSKIRSLNLSHNAVTSITADDLNIHFQQKFTFDLSNNNISEIDLHNYKETCYKMDLNIENNPLKCNCHLYHVLQYSSNPSSMLKEKKLKILTGSSKCVGSNEYKNILLTNLNLKEYKCVPFKKEILHYDMCPSTCNVQKRPADNKLIVDCSNRNLTHSPEMLCLLHYPNSTIELDLTGNQIRDFPNLQQVGYDRVTSLILSKNEISTIPEDIFFNTTLENLTLSNNQLKMLSADALKKIKISVKSIQLGNNPWQCNCEAIHFQNFLLTENMVEDSDSVTCDNSIQLLKNLTNNELCPLTYILVIIFGTIIGVFAFLFFYCRKEIKFWLYVNNCCLRFVTKEELDTEKFYDAFISYSHKDEEFVINELVMNLEKGPKPFKLCLHFRDWLAGVYIPTQIINSIQNSRRTIIVLSPHFLESDWGKLEFKTAYKQGLEEGKTRLIVILYGNIGSFDKLDLDLQKYLKKNTSVKWGDPLFCDKLRYALPHKSEV